MEQEIIKPELNPKPARQAISPLGCMVAASGVTLMMFFMTGAAMMATVWAFSKLLGLPDVMIYVLGALGFLPVLWITIWTAGRAWHVEQLLERGSDIDVPVFKLGHYFRRA